MIDPISAFSALTVAHSTIKKCIEMGKDINSAAGAVQKYAKAEAELGFGKARKKRGIFGGLMDSAIEELFKEEEQKRLKAELKSLFMLYGSPGQWERLQATIAQARAEHKKMLEEKARQRDLLIKTSVVICLLIVGGVGIFYWALYLKGDL